MCGWCGLEGDDYEKMLEHSEVCPESLPVQRAIAAEAEVEGLRMQQRMTVHRLGGEVEGLPTHVGNFLQRIDALRAAEARTVALEEALRECQQQNAKDGPCWCCIPSMIPYRGHDAGCEAARAALKGEGEGGT
jgi:hypothetical protein